MAGEALAAAWHNWQWFGKYIWGETIEIPLEDEAAETDELIGAGGRAP